MNHLRRRHNSNTFIKKKQLKRLTTLLSGTSNIPYTTEFQPLTLFHQTIEPQLDLSCGSIKHSYDFYFFDIYYFINDTVI